MKGCLFEKEENTRAAAEDPDYDFDPCHLHGGKEPFAL